MRNYNEGKKAYKHVYISYNGCDERKEQAVFNNREVRMYCACTVPMRKI
jgi:hypothetical protein